MPRTNFATEKVSTSGWGHQGYCKLCSITDPDVQKGLDQRIGAGWKAPALNDYLIKNVGAGVNRQTIYSHIKHVQNPKDRLVTAVQKRQRTGGFLPAKVSEDQFLDALVASAHQRAVENPDEVTIDHGLRAAQIKAQAKTKGGDVINTLVQIFTSPTALPALTEGITEGVFTEVSEAD